MEKQKIKLIAVYTVIALLVIALILLTFFPGMIYAINDAGKAAEDKCSPPPGSSYTEQSWKEHMGHHPEIYKECLT